MKVKPALRRRHTGKGHVTDGGVAVRVWGDNEGSWVICIAHMEDVSSDYCQMLCMKSIPSSVISPCVRAHSAEHSEQLFWPSPGLRRVALRVLSDFLSHVLCFSNSLVETRSLRMILLDCQLSYKFVTAWISMSCRWGLLLYCRNQIVDTLKTSIKLTTNIIAQYDNYTVRLPSWPGCSWKRDFTWINKREMK